MPLTPLRVLTIVGTASVRIVGGSRRRRGAVFSPAAFRYVDGVIGAIASAALAWFAVSAVNAPAQWDGPGATAVMAGVGAGTPRVAPIAFALRAPLTQDARTRAELSEVIRRRSSSPSTWRRPSGGGPRASRRSARGWHPPTWRSSRTAAPRRRASRHCRARSTSVPTGRRSSPAARGRGGRVDVPCQLAPRRADFRRRGLFHASSRKPLAQWSRNVDHCGHANL